MQEKTEYSKIDEIHKNQPAIIVGSSKSIDIVNYENFKGIVIGMGDGPLRSFQLFRPDYWVCANSCWPRPWLNKDASAINLIMPKMFFLGVPAFAAVKKNTILDCAAKIDVNLKCDYFVYDQRHFNSKSCKEYASCCEASKVYKIKETIQEKFSIKFRSQLYSTGDTVAIHALAIAMIMGCNPIYIIGVDIPTKKSDYTYYESKMGNILVNEYKTTGPFPGMVKTPILKRIKIKLKNLNARKNNAASVFESDLDNIINDFKIIAEAASKAGVKIVNLGEKSNLRSVFGFDNDFEQKIEA